MMKRHVCWMYWVMLVFAMSQTAYARFEPQKIAVGGRHTCVLSTDGRIKCWGNNDNGAGGGKDQFLRHGLNQDSMGPNLPFVDLGKDVVAVDICLGAEHSCAVTKDGRVKCWGSTGFGQVGNGKPDNTFAKGDALPYANLGKDFIATKIACGTYHTCAVSDQQKAKCWGINNIGNLGVGDKVDRGKKPEQMGDNLPFVSLNRPIKQLTAGNGITCAKSDDGVRCWGYGNDGALGQESTNSIGDQPKPAIDELQPIKLLGSDQEGTVGELTSMISGNCALIATAPKGLRKVKCWGYGPSLGLGENYRNRGNDQKTMGANLPFLDLDMGDIAEVQGYGGYACARSKNGVVKCWGRNNRGGLGLGDTYPRGGMPSEMGKGLPPVDLGLPALALGVGSTSSHACALLINHLMKCWGANSSGQLGYENGIDMGELPNQMGETLPFVRLE